MFGVKYRDDAMLTLLRKVPDSLAIYNSLPLLSISRDYLSRYVLITITMF